MEYLLHYKDMAYTICNNMSELWGYYAKWNKSEKVKHNMISFICSIIKTK